jgi:hypothetical protein
VGGELSKGSLFLAGRSKIVPQQKGDIVAALKLNYSKQEHQYAYSNSSHPSTCPFIL